ncbi:MAG TPA: site-specific integrase [Chryseolinea sp.]
MNKTLKIYFLLKKRSGYTMGPLPVYMRVTVNRQRIEVTTQREIEPDKWDAVRQIAKSNTNEARQLNSFLDSLRNQIYEAQRDLLNRGEEITALALKNIIYGNAGASRTLCDAFDHTIAQVKALVGREYAIGTLKRYNAAYAALKAFVVSKYKVQNLPLKGLSLQFIVEFEFFLKSVRKVQHNTAMGIIKKLKRVIHLSLANEWIEKDPFANYKIKVRETNRGFLTEHELTAISNKVFLSERLSQIRDIFVFCCFTGLSYSDVKALTRGDIATGIDGEKWIFTTRQKTKAATRIPLLSPALEIIARYDQHIICVNNGKLLPVSSNQKTNEYLKEIAERCDIAKNLTFHLARHTFATTVTLTNGVPLETVSKMLGHRTLRATQQYAKIVDLKVSSDMNALRAKYDNTRDQ